MRTRKRDEIKSKKVVSIAGDGPASVKSGKKSDTDRLLAAISALRAAIEVAALKAGKTPAQPDIKISQPEVRVSPTIKIDMPEPAKSFEVTVTERQNGRIHKVRINRIT